MNREQAKQLLPIIQAFADGAQVQVKDGERGWVTRDFYNFNCASEEYRIKPKPLEFWVVVANNISSAVGVFHSRENAESDCKRWTSGRVIHVREVTA